MLTSLALGSSLVVGGLLAGSGITMPEYLNNRAVLVEPTPYPFGRSRIITREVSATPDFVISNSGAFTRTPADRNPWITPGPTHFGACPHASGWAHVRRGQLPILISGFQKYREELPDDFHRARNIWLIEHGYVRSARRVVRADRGVVSCGGCMMDALCQMKTDVGASGVALPEPRAILEIKRQEVPATEGSRLQAIRTTPHHVVITSFESPRTEMAVAVSPVEASTENETETGSEM